LRKIKEAQKILKSLGLPAPQCNEISAITLLALANIGKRDPWSDATPVRLRIHDMLIFAQERYKRKYAENTRETVRRQVIHQFEQARIVDRNPDARDLPTNSPRTHYALTDEVTTLIRSYGSKSWQTKLADFLTDRRTLLEIYRRNRRARMIPVKISPTKEFKLSPGKHNQLQAALIREFAPRFAPGALLVYFGDTAKKMLYLDENLIQNLGILVDRHEKLPDVVLYHADTSRLFLIEAVTSHGPVSPKRHHELEQMFSGIQANRVYVSAFPDFKEFRNHIANIAWETEVWISNVPDHLIHYNGDKFLQ
jgi:type II restriction enzyme